MTDHNGAHVPDLVGKRVALQAPSVEDYDFLFDLERDPEQLVLYRSRGVTYPPENFAANLWKGVLVHLVAWRKDPAERLGLYTCYDADLRHGHAKLAVLARRDIRMAAWPAESAYLFLDYVFQVFPFHKLYLEILDYNLPMLHIASANFIQEEGRLVEHHWHDGERWDLRVFAIYRETWQIYRREQELRRHQFVATSGRRVG